MADGYYLEATAVLDSMVFDRLSSRLYRLKQSASKPHSTGELCRELVGKDGSGGKEIDQSFREVILRIKNWVDLRNEALHATAKVFHDDTSEQTFHAILASHKQTAAKGREYLREFHKLDAESRRNAGARPPASSPEAFFPENRPGRSYASDWRETSRPEGSR